MANWSFHGSTVVALHKARTYGLEALLKSTPVKIMSLLMSTAYLLHQFYPVCPGGWTMQPHSDCWLLSLTFLNVCTIMFTDFDLKNNKKKSAIFSLLRQDNRWQSRFRGRAGGNQPGPAGIEKAFWEFLPVSIGSDWCSIYWTIALSGSWMMVVSQIRACF